MNNGRRSHGWGTEGVQFQYEPVTTFVSSKMRYRSTLSRGHALLRHSRRQVPVCVMWSCVVSEHAWLTNLTKILAVLKLPTETVTVPEQPPEGSPWCHHMHTHTFRSDTWNSSFILKKKKKKTPNNVTKDNFLLRKTSAWHSFTHKDLDSNLELFCSSSPWTSTNCVLYSWYLLINFI